jgi:hypothetical protein
MDGAPLCAECWRQTDKRVHEKKPESIVLGGMDCQAALALHVAEMVVRGEIDRALFAGLGAFTGPTNKDAIN